MMTILSHKDLAGRRERGRVLQREGNRRGLPETSFVILSTFNVDLLPLFLGESLERQGLYCQSLVGPYGQVAQEILDPHSRLYRTRPEAVLLLPAVEDLLAPIFSRPLALGPEEMEALVQEQAAAWEGWIRLLLERLPAAVCYLVVPGTDRVPMAQILDPAASGRGQAAVVQLQQSLRALSAISPRVVLADWEWHTRAGGLAHYRDDRLWYLARMRLNPLGLASLAELIATHVAAYRGMARKVAVVDLDNTLWGGIVGEVGLGGLVLGDEGLGLAFRDFQQELLHWHDAGVLLAICSKNNPDDVWEVFDRHPGMLLRREQFAAARINWVDKATNLLELSEELSLGVDSFVFLDDNPVEQQWIRQSLPEVVVPDLPADPVDRPELLRRLPYFQRIGVTEADRRRAESYRAQGLRRRLQETAGSLEEFLTSLEQEVTIEPLQEGSLARAAQLCQRTNQFNLTTQRYTVGDLERLKRDPTVELYTLAVKDRFGDSGITGLAILRWEADSAEIDTLLLSCRILGRRVEDLFLSFLAERARARGVPYLIGRYLPTAKNASVAGWYPQRGFEPTEEGSFRLNLAEQPPVSPLPMKVKVIADA